MALTVTHPFVCGLADDPVEDAAGGIVISDWNAEHAVSLVSLGDGDGSQVLWTKNTNVDNADNGDLRVSASAYDANPISGRWNQVYRIGYNMAASGIGYDAGEPSMGIQWESFYEQGGAEYLEWHQSVFKHTDDSEVRFESWAIDRSTYVVSKSSTFETWAWYKSDGTVLAQWFLSAGTFYADFPSTRDSTFRFGKNDSRIWQQRNAANSAYINLPYVNTYDRLKCETSAWFTAATPTTGDYANVFVAFAPSGTTAHASINMQSVGPTVDGAYTHLYCTGSYKWNSAIKIYNSYGSDGASAEFRATAASGGADPISIYEIYSGLTWSVGADNSDSDAFIVAKNSSPGTNNALRIDTSLNSRFYGNLGIADATNGQACEIKTLTELLTIAAAATSTTTIQKPANSIILAVPVRVTTAVTCTSTFTVGDAGSATRFSTAAVSKAVNTTDKGTAAGAYYNATAEGIVITPDTVPSDATGRVRVTIYYIELTPPTS